MPGPFSSCYLHLRLLLAALLLSAGLVGVKADAQQQTTPETVELRIQLELPDARVSGV